jgi:hypothetical protein
MNEKVDYEKWFLKSYDSGFCNLSTIIKVRGREKR